MSSMRLAPYSLLVLFFTLGCDEKTSSPAAPPPAPIVKEWSLDVDLGSGLQDVKTFTSVRGIHYSSRIVHGRINGFSRAAFKDTIGVGSISGSVDCAISDSGTFSFPVGNLIMPDAQSTLGFLPWPREGFKLSPETISIVVYNY